MARHLDAENLVHLSEDYRDVDDLRQIISTQRYPPLATTVASASSSQFLLNPEPHKSMLSSSFTFRTRSLEEKDRAVRRRSSKGGPWSPTCRLYQLTNDWRCS
jgi:hypothetical protein